VLNRNDRIFGGDVMQPVATPGEMLRALAPLTGFLRVVETVDTAPGWIDREALQQPNDGALSIVLGWAAAPELGEADSRKAASAWFMLRFGWSCGVAIAGCLAFNRAIRLDDYALKLPPGRQIEAKCVKSAEVCAADGPGSQRQRLLTELVAYVEPVLDAQHRWSGSSRGALWALVTSSWASHFIHMGQQLGDEQRGRREAEALFGLLPRVRRAAPRLFTVVSGEREGVCQVRRACCRNHRRSGGQFCSSCPLLADAERQERYRNWVATRPLRRVAGLAFAGPFRAWASVD